MTKGSVAKISRQARAAALTPAHRSVLEQIEQMIAAHPREQVRLLKSGGASQQKLDKWRSGSSPRLSSLEDLAPAFNCVLTVRFVDMSESSATTISHSNSGGDPEMPSDEALKLARMIDELPPMDRAQMFGVLQGLHLKASGSSPR
jgi:hypothetical protein